MLDVIGPSEGVDIFAMSPYAKWFVTTSVDGPAQLWRTQDRTQHGAPLPHAARIEQLDFSRDESRMSTRSVDGVVRVWDTETATLRSSFVNPDAQFFSHLVSDGQHVVTLSQPEPRKHVIRRWDASTGALVAESDVMTGLVATLGTGDAVILATSMAGGELIDTATMRPLAGIKALSQIRSDGREDASGYWTVVGFVDGTVVYGSRSPKRFDAQPTDTWTMGEPPDARLQLQDAPVTIVAISGDGHTVAAGTGAREGEIAVVAAPSGEPVGSPIHHRTPVGHIELSYDGALLAGVSGDTARVWSTRTGQDLTGPLTFPVVSDEDAEIAFGSTTPDDMVFPRGLAFSRNTPVELFVKVNRTSPVYVYSAERTDYDEVADYGVDGWYVPLGMPADASTLVTSSTRGRVAEVWDANTLEARAGPVSLARAALWWRDRLVAVSPDGSRLAVSTSKSVQQYATESGQPVGEAVATEMAPRGLAYSPDGAWLSFADGAQVRFVNPRGAQESASIDMGERVRDMAFQQDGRFLAMAVGRLVRFLSYPDGAEALRPITHSVKVDHIALNPQGDMLATVTADSFSHVWNISTGEQLGESLRPSAGVYDLAFHPTERRLATADGNGRVTFWDTDTGQQYGSPISVPGHVQQIILTPDGEHLFTGGNSGAALRWRLPVPPASLEEMERRTWATTGLRSVGEGYERLPRAEWRALRAEARAGASATPSALR